MPTELETRYTMLAHSDPEGAKRLLDRAQEAVRARWRDHAHLAEINITPNGNGKVEEK